MRTFKYIRAALVAAAFTALTLSSGATPHVMRGALEKLSVVNADAAESVTGLPEPIDATSTFFSVRRDLRRCVSPLCGGYFVARVNASTTRCADGRFSRECYVAEVNWSGQPQPDGAHLLVRGTIVAKRYERFGNLGELRVSESWKSLSTNKPVGTFYLVRDRGVRCIAFPCPTHSEAKLNSSFSRNIAAVKLEGAGLGENNADIVTVAMTGPDGVIVAGHDSPVKGPGGRSFELKATQVYVRNKSDVGSMKPCIKTGCSSQVCADHNVITTCEFRPEYECYQKATCERQSDGNCRFTKTPELTACLARK
jgi:Domain of unknown function (DUF6748)